MKAKKITLAMASMYRRDPRKGHVDWYGEERHADVVLLLPQEVTVEEARRQLLEACNRELLGLEDYLLECGYDRSVLTPFDDEDMDQCAPTKDDDSRIFWYVDEKELPQ